MKSSIYGFTPEDTINFFESLGLKLKTERGNRVFPVSDKSSDVIKTLEKALINSKVDIHLNENVLDIEVESSGVKGVITDKTYYSADKIVIATGGITYPSTGSTGDGFNATIISTNIDADYVVSEDKKFIPTKLGIEVTDALQEGFNNIINVEYTAKMEDDLDKIAEGKLVWNNTLQDFYQEFEPAIESAFAALPKKEAEKTGEMCPDCGSPLVIRKGRYGEFTACSNYPNCKYIKIEPKEVVEICNCPNCDGKIVEKRSKKGKIFYGCNHYPKCKTAYWNEPTGEKCPKCGEMFTRKNETIECSSCHYIKEGNTI